MQIHDQPVFFTDLHTGSGSLAEFPGTLAEQ